MSVIYLVRHGQASIKSSNYDILSERGKLQAEIVGRNFRERVDDFDFIQMGELNRHIETYEAFTSKFRNTAKVDKNEKWNEYNHMDIIERYKPAYKRRWYMIADMTRKLNPKRDFVLMFDKAIKRWKSGDYDEEYVESWQTFQNRCNDVLSKLILDLNQDGKAIVFTSGGVISAIAQRLLNLPDEYFMRFNKKFVNCGVTKVISTENETFISTLNDYGHFEKRRDLITYI